jgi:hypothetical protein
MRIPAGLIACAGLLLGLLSSAQAGPLSIGVSNQQQTGWVVSSRSASRLTRILEEGTAGRNIKPADGGRSFSLYGTSFVQDNPSDSFDYRSIVRDTSTVSDTQTETLTIYATQTNTYNTVNTPALGYFQQGNSAFGAN